MDQAVGNRSRHVRLSTARRGSKPRWCGVYASGLGAFWGMRSGQYADLDGAAWRVLQDDDAGAEHRSDKG